MDFCFIQFAVVTGNTVKLYKAKIIKMKYKLIQIQEIYYTVPILCSIELV